MHHKEMGDFALIHKMSTIYKKLQSTHGREIFFQSHSDFRMWKIRTFLNAEGQESEWAELAAEMVLVSSYVKWANSPHPHMHLEVQVRWWGQRPSTWQTWATLGVPFHTTELFMAILIFQFLGQMLRNKRQLREAPNFKELPMHRGARKVGGCMLQVFYHLPKVHMLGRFWREETLCWCIKGVGAHLQHLCISLFSLGSPLETGRG